MHRLPAGAERGFGERARLVPSARQLFEELRSGGVRVRHIPLPQRAYGQAAEIPAARVDLRAARPFTLEIDGPARFGNGSTTVTGTSGDYTTVITWHATGDGPVTVTGSATVPSIDRIISTQDMVTLGSGHMQAIDEVTIPVRYSFNPTITTRISPKSIDTGAPVTDDVQVSALPGSGAWPRGAQVHARGWYFGGLPVSDRGRPVAEARRPVDLEGEWHAGHCPSTAVADMQAHIAGARWHWPWRRHGVRRWPRRAKHWPRPNPRTISSIHTTVPPIGLARSGTIRQADDTTASSKPDRKGWCGRTAEGIPKCGYSVVWRSKQPIHIAPNYCTDYPHLFHIKAQIAEPFTPV